MGNLSGVVGHLKKELKRAQQEVQRFTAALAALGSSGSNGGCNGTRSLPLKFSRCEVANFSD
jgi:hypothetical protein